MCFQNNQLRFVSNSLLQISITDTARMPPHTLVDMQGTETPASAWDHNNQNLCRVGMNNTFQPQRRYLARNGPWQNRAKRRLRMARDIERYVHNFKSRDSLKNHPFHLVHVNYYCKHSSGRYLGCEIAIAEFTLMDGSTRTFNAFINPGDIPIGYAFAATKRSARTHRMPLPLPLPLDRFGSESDHPQIFNNIISFLTAESEDKTKLPRLYTRPRDISAVVSVLRQLSTSALPYMNEGRCTFRVYPASKLFHELRNRSMGVPSDVILLTNFLDEHELDNDDMQYTEGISCYFHEKTDAAPHCSLSCVQRWSFLVLRECCRVLRIRMIPGNHCPFSSRCVMKARFPCWKRRPLCYYLPSPVSAPGQPRSLQRERENVTMAGDFLETQPTAEGNTDLQTQPPPQWPNPSLPLQPLRRPVTTSTALRLMHPSPVTAEDLAMFLDNITIS
jgi:hypothetical protein